jgi:NAD(P)-dependent dehydrogenase (short-subunit alcohol dehydrogenase family)
MIIDLTGRKAVVTGSTAGIGRPTAEGLARAGASVVINGRGSERVNKAVPDLRQAFPDRDISGVAADLATTEGAEALLAQAPECRAWCAMAGAASYSSAASPPSTSPRR